MCPILASFPSVAMSTLRAVFCDEVDFLIFEKVSAFRDSFTYELNSTDTPPLDKYIGSIIQAGKCAKSHSKSMPSLLFCAIVAVVEVEVGR